MNTATIMKQRKARKGFSLVELVVVILIIAVLAVAVFAGGSTVIKKSQVSRTTSDLHNFSVAVEAFMNETPSVANSAGTANFAKLSESFVKSLNENLAADYQMAKGDGAAFHADGYLNAGSDYVAGATKAISANIGCSAPATHTRVYESKKTDAWGNHYYVIFDSEQRHGLSNSDFYIYVVSAGPDAKTDLGGVIGGAVTGGKEDDIFLLVQYENGNVSAVTYNMASDTLYKGTDSGAVAMSDTEKKASNYCYTPAATPTGLDATVPVNF